MNSCPSITDEWPFQTHLLSKNIISAGQALVSWEIRGMNVQSSPVSLMKGNLKTVF